MKAATLLTIFFLALGGVIAVASPVSAATISQVSPTANTVTVDGSSTFTDQLNVTGNTGTMNYAATGGDTTHFLVSSTGKVTTSGLLAAGSYSFSGTDGDTSSDTGIWNYTLTVTISQVSPTANTVTVDGSSTFTDQLNVTGNTGTMNYAATGGDTTHLLVSSTGKVTTSGLLAAGSYSFSGTEGDTSSDTGIWNYTLTVTASTIAQVGPLTGLTLVDVSSVFTDQLQVNGNNGAVTYAATGGDTTHLLVSSTGKVTTSGFLAAGRYLLSGTDLDASGDTGVWSYTLNINSQPSTGGGTIKQTSSVSGATTTEASASYVIGPIVVDNAVGTVTYVTTTSSGGLSVSQSGDITTSGTLVAGIYTVSGTDSDSSGDSGTWTYSLTVSNITTYAVTFSANGGTGTMAVESENTPTALALNSFKRSGYTFKKWSTAANGTGSIYADGSTYPFTSSTTLYAQWTVVKVVKVVKKGKGIKKPAAHVVRFNAHGGTGSMATEKDTVPTGLTANRFTRGGYSFVQWNTAANGSGSNFANGALFPFTSSTTLYAQWKASPSYVVRFNGHGGSGTMAAERGKVPAALTPNRFTRRGFTFTRWNTAANGSGSNFANGALFPFTSSTTLYAQWKAKKVVAAKPAVDAVVTLGKFAAKSSILSTALQTQVSNLAREIKANRDTNIALVGYGDTLLAANQLNESAWAANFSLSEHRATAVEAFLEQQLKTLGVTGYTISALGNGTANPGASSATAAEKAKNGKVIASLT